MKAINQLYPPIALDESWEMEVANRIVSIADWASEAPVIVDYFRFLRSVWSHCLFVTRYFPSVNSRRSLGDKDFPSGQTTALEMMSTAHQIYVLKSYEVAGDVAEFGCFKGFSSSMLSYACKLIDIKMQVFDSFEGLPQSNSVYYSAGDFRGDLEEVKENVRIYGSVDSVDFHKGYFDISLKSLILPQLKLIWMDVDLETSATDVMSIADRLNPKGNIFCHECVPSNFMNSEIRAARGSESVIPPIIDKFEALGAPLRGTFISGYTGGRRVVAPYSVAKLSKGWLTRCRESKILGAHPYHPLSTRASRLPELTPIPRIRGPKLHAESHSALDLFRRSS